MIILNTRRFTPPSKQHLCHIQGRLSPPKAAQTSKSEAAATGAELEDAESHILLHAPWGEFNLAERANEGGSWWLQPPLLSCGLRFSR